MNKMKMLAIFAISSVLTGTASAATIDKIEALTNNTVQITSSNDVVFSDVTVEGEIKLLKDVPVSFSAKDSINSKKVLINLSTDLTANTSYSLITILGAEGNIDFSIGDYLAGEIKNPNYDETVSGIEKVNIIDSRTIELYYNTELTSDTFEFKILSDIVLNSIKSEGNNILKLESSKNLEKSTDYIVMILALKDAMGVDVVLDEDLYDFTTSADLVEAIPEEQAVIASTQEEIVPVEEGNIVDVASKTDKTPETGTATGILVMLAVILNLGFFLRKKFIK